MERVIKKHKEEKVIKEFIPVFNGVNSEDVDDLLYEVFKWELEDVPIFDKVKNEPFWIDFGKSMIKMECMERQMIYLKGEQATYFYLIKEGSVEFNLPSDDHLPFYQV